MSIVVDLIIVAIILLFTFLGYKRGIVKLAFSLCTFFIAIILAFMLYKPISNLVIDNTQIDENIQSTITNKILPEGHSDTEEVDDSYNLPDIVLKNTENTVKDISRSFAVKLIGIVCFLLIFIVAKIVLKFVTILADLIAKLPILKQINELGGTIYGLLEGCIVVFALLAIISLVAPMLDTAILESIDNSYIGSFCYNHNILLGLIK